MFRHFQTVAGPGATVPSGRSRFPDNHCCTYSFNRGFVISLASFGASSRCLRLPLRDRAPVLTFPGAGGAVTAQLAGDRVGVLPGGDQQLPADLGADSFDLEQLWADLLDEGRDELLEFVDLLGPVVVLSSQDAERDLCRDRRVAGAAGVRASRRADREEVAIGEVLQCFP